ncbi:MAG: hypothetical protein IPO58_12550 [Betaproteobacteria bacterium]|nr:hypothetical protein [Betaproteobacteria bacterium]
MNQAKPASPGRRKFTAGVAVATVAPTMFFIGKARAAERVVVRAPGGVDDVKKETIYDPFRGDGHRGLFPSRHDRGGRWR